MSAASPFQANSGPFMEIPEPMRIEKEVESKNLEDVPFKSPFEGIKASSEAPTVPGEEEKRGWFARLFAGRKARAKRDEVLLNEIHELRSDYQSLVSVTKEIRGQLDVETERREKVEKVLTPFPAVMEGTIEGLEKVRSGQLEAEGLLSKIRDDVGSVSGHHEKMVSTVDTVVDGIGRIEEDFARVDGMLGRMDGALERVDGSLGQIDGKLEEVAGGVGQVSSGVAAVNETLTDLTGRVSAAGDQTAEGFAGMDKRFEELLEVNRESAEKAEQSSEDMLHVLKRMEEKSQRGWWFLAVISVILVVLLGMVVLGETGKGGTKGSTTPSDLGSGSVTTQSMLSAGGEAVALSDD